MRMPQVIWKVDIGHVLTILALVVAAAISWGSTSSRLDQHTQTLIEVRKTLTVLDDKMDVLREQQVKTATELADRLATGKSK